MRAIVAVYGLLMIVAGIVGLVRTGAIREIIKKSTRLIDNRPIGILPLVFGIICILSTQSPKTHLPSFVAIIGALSIVKALCLFFLEKEKLSACIEFYQKMPDSYCKVLSGACVVLGILLL